MKRIVVLAALGLLAACTGMVESTEKAKNGLRAGIYNSAEKVQEMTRYNPPSKDPQAPQTGYCYKTASDIVCYDSPQSNLTSKLAGAQVGEPSMTGDSGHMMPAAYHVAPVEPVQVNPGRTTPFFVKEAPYIKADGEVQPSTKVLPQHQSLDVRGQTGTGVIMPGQAASSNTVYTPIEPKPLMPRH